MGQNIGVFDSGIGGLSVYREIKKLLPNRRIIYLADHKNAPYGTKSQKKIKELTGEAVEFLVLKNCNTIVIACNTATTSGIDFYRRKFPSISFVGVVPPIKPAATASKSRKIIILSTTTTSKSRYLKGLIKEFAYDCEVWNLGCPELVEAVESGLINSLRTKYLLKKYLDKPINDGADAIVLGCTHFPFLRDTLKEIYGNKITIADSSKPVALQVLKLSKNKQPKSSKITKTKDYFYTSGNATKVSIVAYRLLSQSIIFKSVSEPFARKVP